MKYSYPWNGCISIDDTYDKHRGTYELILQDMPI